MEIDLQDSAFVDQPPITQITVHNIELEPQFRLLYDVTKDAIEFSTPDMNPNPTIDRLIQFKDVITHQKGIEAIGSLIAGADNSEPVYQHLLTLYIPIGEGKFDKFHVTLSSRLEKSDWKYFMILAAECYSILYRPIQEFIKTGEINTQRFPLLKQFFHRSYTHPVYDKIIEKSEKKTETAIAKLSEIIEQFSEQIKSTIIYFTTISGAIITEKVLLGEKDPKITLNHLTNHAVMSPGMTSSTGALTFWYPYTKTKVGKINRTINTTLISLQHATNQRQNPEQTQLNTAHKFHELVEVIGDVQQSNLQTNIGNLVCTIQFDKEYQKQLDGMMEIAQKISPYVKQYGGHILSEIAQKSGGFKPIK